MFNFRDSNTTLKRTKDVAAASTVAVEGALLIRALEGGVEKVKPSTGTGSGEIPVGFALLDNETFTQNVLVETVHVPAAGPYTVTLSHGLLAGTGPASYEVMVMPASGTPYTQEAGAGATLKFEVTTAATGLLTFNAANAGVALTVQYRVNLLASEAQQQGMGLSTSDGGPGVRSINNTASAQFKSVTVYTGHGEIFTKEFDAAANWNSGVISTMPGNPGRLTMGGGGTDVSAFMRVIKVPTVDDPHLGLAINMTA